MCNAATNGFTLTESYLVGQSSEELTTLTWSGSKSTWVRTNVYGDGKLLGTYDSAGLHFHLTDPLGTRRVQTNAEGLAEQNCQSLPDGDAQNCYPVGTASGVIATPLFFTGKERDTESGLDYFGARYYGSSMGRFLSPDPSGLYYADPSNPQSLNLYSYAQNNPLTNTDPTGLACVYFNDAGSGVESVDHNTSSGECGSNGGDYVNGATSANQIQYNANSDTFNIQSSSTFHNYNSTAYAPGPGGGGNGIPCSGNCDTANGYSSSFKLPQFTLQVGVAGNYGFGPLATTAFTGLIVDSHGHFGRYGGGGAGLGLGAGGSAGIQAGISNGNGICSYGGPFGNVSLTGGEGVGGTLDGFAGYGDGPGGVVSGSSITAGIAGGVDAAATVTETKVTPFGGKKCQ